MIYRQSKKSQCLEAADEIDGGPGVEAAQACEAPLTSLIDDVGERVEEKTRGQVAQKALQLHVGLDGRVVVDDAAGLSLGLGLRTLLEGQEAVEGAGHGLH